MPEETTNTCIEASGIPDKRVGASRRLESRHYSSLDSSSDVSDDPVKSGTQLSLNLTSTFGSKQWIFTCSRIGIALLDSG